MNGEYMEWISVKNKLPKHGQIVDIWVVQNWDIINSRIARDEKIKPHRVRDCIFKIEKDKDEGDAHIFIAEWKTHTWPFFKNTWCVENFEVSHWMPITTKIPPQKEVDQMDIDGLMWYFNYGKTKETEHSLEDILRIRDRFK